MAVIITGPLDTPTNLSATAVAGGSLTASTTYYFRIVALETVNTMNYGDTNPVHGRQSAPSAEFSATTTDTNKQIELTWDAVADATSYDIYVTTTSGDYSATYPKLAPLGDYQRTVDTNSFAYDGTETMKYLRHTFASEEGIPIGKDVGTILINFTGTTTLQDIYDQCVIDGYADFCSYDGINFNLKGSIYLTGSVVSAITMKAKNLVFVQGELKNSNENATVIFGRNWGSNIYQDGCSVSYMGKCSTIICGVNYQIYNSFFRWPACPKGNVYAPATRELGIFGPYGGTITIDSDYTQNLISMMGIMFLANSSAEVKAMKYWDHCVQFGANDLTVSNFIAWYGYITITRSGLVLRDFERKYGTGNDFSMNKVGVWTLKIVNADLNAANPAVWWRSTTTAQIDRYWVFDLTVVDATATGISGATVTITDVNGDAVTGSPFTTDANGNISEDILATITTNDPDGTVRDSVHAQKTPHTVTITKASFKTKVVKLTMDRRREEIETLEQVLNLNFSKRVKMRTQ